MCFLDIKRMRGKILYILLFILSLSCALTAGAQQNKAVYENIVLEAVQKFDSENYNAAIDMLAAVLDKDPENDAACYYIALSYVYKNELEAAEFYLKKAVELDRSNFWYRQRLANLYKMTSRGELAIDVYEKLLADFPKKSDIYLELVELYAAMNDIDKALETIKEVETIFGVTETLAVYRFNLLRMADRQDEAFGSLEEYNEKYSSQYVLCTLGDWQVSMYKDSTALAYYNEALELDSEYAPAQIGKAETLRMQRNYDGFFSMLNKFVKNEYAPVKSKTDYLMAVVKGTDPKFLRFFTPRIDSVMTGMLGKHAKDSVALETAGLWYYSTGRNDKAADCFRQNAREYPKSLSAIAGYVEFLMVAEMWEEISEEGRKAFATFPNEPAFLEMASVGDYNLNRYDKVLEICDKVLEVAPADSSHALRAWSTKGDIYHSQGDSKKAYKAYDRALKINPDYVYVLNNYAYYLSQEGKNLKKAYDMSKKTIEKEPDNATYLDTFGWIIYLLGRPLEAKPFFKRAMLHGGKDSPVILDHYADVLFALKEYDMAFVYWNIAKQKNASGEVKGLDEKVKQKRQEAGK